MMSLALVAITSRSTASPMRSAASPAKMSPKLPVGTTKVAGLPSAAVAVK